MVPSNDRDWQEPIGRFPARKDLQPELQEVLESASRLQRLVPDAVLVGGSAAALYAGHRASYDHDYDLRELRANFDLVLEALESDDGWAVNRLTYGKIILGELGGIETGLRQLIRLRPLEVAEVQLTIRNTVMVPTSEETLRIKAFLITKRNQTRNYLDVAALADHVGLERAALVLSGMDEYYADQAHDGAAVSSQVARQLGHPLPNDSGTTTRLEGYKGLSARWLDWQETVNLCQQLSAQMVSGEEES
ncbi:hypothetical protein [Paenarthrobacter sp. PH39-S1]|uniref:hypothetical protein n=1 Tax=Paenarthrobacter sp. PH39-S1 TaxID=3046204 RepID=UPI0024BA4442|nr:hypothetical protein [Paenarthrobacter sp. PH39-S1]MDJ0355057.1 hypothetical protein [Paenarthrobacter sp. PH39-S1]